MRLQLFCARRRVSRRKRLAPRGAWGRDSPGSRAESAASQQLGQLRRGRAETVRERGKLESVGSLRPNRKVKEAVARSSKKRVWGIITALKLASPVAVIAREGSGVSCRCRHPEGPVSTCGYCFPIRASEAIDSC